MTTLWPFFATGDLTGKKPKKKNKKKKKNNQKAYPFLFSGLFVVCLFVVCLFVEPLISDHSQKLERLKP